jgi:4-hydroxy-tetrahydrodipicolinate synthase
MPLLDETAHGVHVIVATPFTDDGDVDYESGKRLIEFHIGQGVHGATILGVFGEAPKLTQEESLQFVRAILEQVKGRIPVTVGVSAPGLDNLQRFATQVMEAGAAGVMVAPIPGLRSDDQVFGYYEQVAQRLGDIPWVLQDYPQTTTVFMSPAVILRMIRAFPRMVMLKAEDCPGLNKISTIRRTSEAEGLRRISILIGNGGLHYPQEMLRGADGAMTGYAYTEMLVRFYELFRAGDVEAAEDLFDAHLPLVRHELQPGLGLAMRKHVLKKRGAIASSHVRAPGPKLNKTDVEELERLIARMERRVAELEKRRRAA